MRLAWFEHGPGDSTTPAFRTDPCRYVWGKVERRDMRWWAPRWRMAQRTSRILNQERFGHALGSTTELTVHPAHQRTTSGRQCLVAAQFFWPREFRFGSVPAAAEERGIVLSPTVRQAEHRPSTIVHLLTARFCSA
jgi:hypothetical protein